VEIANAKQTKPAMESGNQLKNKTKIETNKQLRQEQMTQIAHTRESKPTPKGLRSGFGTGPWMALQNSFLSSLKTVFQDTLGKHET